MCVCLYIYIYIYVERERELEREREVLLLQIIEKKNFFPEIKAQTNLSFFFLVSVVIWLFISYSCHWLHLKFERVKVLQKKSLKELTPCLVHHV